MTKRLLVTGGTGFVAGSVIAQGWDEWDIHSLSRNEAPVQHHGLSWHQLDLLNTEQLRHAFDRIKPHAVVHAAAIADIDTCQVHQDVARRLNVEVTAELADLCGRAGAKMVFLSTDTVFDGHRGDYAEDDPPAPINYYAETKVAAEEIVADRVADGVIARLALVVGLPVLGVGNSSLARMTRGLEEGREQGMFVEEIRTPIDVITLGQALLELAGRELTGCFHLAGNDVLNRLEIGLQIAETFGYSKDLVVAKDSRLIPGRAPRPRDVSLNNHKARAMLETPMQPLDRGLDLILAARRERRA
jgi:dTDP-4-dehydrorhamnose reductase